MIEVPAELQKAIDAIEQLDAHLAWLEKEHKAADAMFIAIGEQQVDGLAVMEEQLTFNELQLDTYQRIVAACGDWTRFQMRKIATTQMIAALKELLATLRGAHRAMVNQATTSKAEPG